MVQRSCADLKRAREEALRAALAQLHDWQFDELPEPTATLLPLDRPLELAPPTARRARRERRARWLGWAGLLTTCLLGGVLLARQSAPDHPPPAAAAATSTAPSTQLASMIVLGAPGAAARAPLGAAPRGAAPQPPAELVPVVVADAPSAQPARVKASKAQRRTVSRAPRATAPRRPPLSAKTAQPVAVLPVPCNPPYVIDAHGIKRFRRDCMGSP
jgi:hypothetical protein